MLYERLARCGFREECQKVGVCFTLEDLSLHAITSHLDLVTVTPFGEIVEGYLGLVTFLLDVIQDRHELTSRYETGEHCYGLGTRIKKYKGGKSRDAKRVS